MAPLCHLQWLSNAAEILLPYEPDGWAFQERSPGSRPTAAFRLLRSVSLMQLGNRNYPFHTFDKLMSSGFPTRIVPATMLDFRQTNKRLAFHQSATLVWRLPWSCSDFCSNCLLIRCGDVLETLATGREGERQLPSHKTGVGTRWVVRSDTEKGCG